MWHLLSHQSFVFSEGTLESPSYSCWSTSPFNDLSHHCLTLDALWCIWSKNRSAKWAHVWCTNTPTHTHQYLFANVQKKCSSPLGWPQPVLCQLSSSSWHWHQPQIRADRRNYRDLHGQKFLQGNMLPFYFLILYNYQCFGCLEESSILMKNSHSSLIYAKLGC